MLCIIKGKTKQEDNEILFAFHNALVGSQISGDGDGESEEQECGENEYRLSTGECVTDFYPECEEGEFYNKYASSSCIACPTEGNPVETHTGDIEDTCERCTGAQIGGYDPRYCVYCPDGVTCGDKCCGKDEKCQYSSGIGTCVSALGTNKCMTNDDCTGDNQYCKNTYSCDVVIGTCTNMSTATVEINETTYTTSTGSMSYHAAENFCQALGKSLAPLTDGCTADELAAVKANGSGSCSGWARTTGKYYWTRTKLSGCGSYYITSDSSGAVGSRDWGYNGYALCR